LLAPRVALGASGELWWHLRPSHLEGGLLEGFLPESHRPPRPLPLYCSPPVAVQMGVIVRRSCAGQTQYFPSGVRPQTAPDSIPGNNPQTSPHCLGISVGPGVAWSATRDPLPIPYVSPDQTCRRNCPLCRIGRVVIVQAGRRRAAWGWLNQFCLHQPVPRGSLIIQWLFKRMEAPSCVGLA
jgi:hypothetical protein